jgi:hypothetical protein
MEERRKMNWIESHQTLIALAWPILTAILTGIFKPRSPEAYDKMPPRVAAFFKLLGALGLDVPNTIEAIGQALTGRKDSASVYKSKRESP